MLSLNIFTNWAVGLINGYKQKENGLPNGIKYGTIGISTSIAMIRTLTHLGTAATLSESIVLATATPGQKLFAVFVGVPVVMGMNFCSGHHMGKAIRYVEDEPRPNKSGVKIQLL